MTLIILFFTADSELRHEKILKDKNTIIQMKVRVSYLSCRWYDNYGSSSSIIYATLDMLPLTSLWKLQI